LVRQSLLWCGQPDPCEGRKNIEAESDQDYQALAALLFCWQECYGEKSVTLKHAIDDIGARAIATPDAITPANEWNRLQDALTAFDSRYDGKRLDTKRIGNAFRSIQNRVIGRLRLIRADDYQGTIQWKVQAMS
jgi:hypothetical protein